MNDTLSSSSEWMKLHQQTIDSSLGFSDATTVTGNNFIPSSSFVAGDHLTPKGCISKPIRRRSRASKRTPTTLLNADAKNFRYLVQQFTGCRRRSTSISFGNPRGPVNINFAHAKNHDCYSTDHASILSQQPFVDTNYCWKSQLQQQEEHRQQHYQYQQQQLSNEEQEREFSFDSITTDHDNLLLTSCLPRSGSDEIPQGFVMDDMYFLA